MVMSRLVALNTPRLIERRNRRVAHHDDSFAKHWRNVVEVDERERPFASI